MADNHALKNTLDLCEIEKLEAQIIYQSTRIGILENGLRGLLSHHRHWAETAGKREQRFYHEQQAKVISEILEAK